MSTSARKSAAAKGLLNQVAKRSTGCLSSPDSRVSVFFMGGDIIGAVAADDDLQLLRRVRMARGLEPRRLVALDKVVRAGQPIFGQLLDEVDPDMIEALLLDRFRNNLVGFISMAMSTGFEARPGVFVDNMQMGQNTARLIDAACKAAERATRFPPDLELTYGAGEGRDERETALVDALGDDTLSIEELVANSAVEPWLGRAMVCELLDRGVFVEANVELEDLAPHDEEDDEDLSDMATVQSTNELLMADTIGDDDDEEEEESEVVERLTPPADLASWMNNGELSEEDMAFFEDHEADRGAGQGGFSTELHNLDKVDVTGAQEVEYNEPVPVEEEVLEAEEAPAAKFSAPVISESDALEKIEVCNDTLRKISSALDAAQGAGRGRTQIQLLVDGTQSKFATLLHDLSITEQGEIPPDEMLDNLASRPPTEHRQLMNTTLKNVIERGLSLAADELDDDQFDELYESVAGYNQRLGL